MDNNNKENNKEERVEDNYIFMIECTHPSGKVKEFEVDMSCAKMTVPEMIRFYQKNIYAIGGKFLVTCAGEYDGYYAILED